LRCAHQQGNRAMQQVHHGDIVRIHFTARRLDGRVFGSSAGKDPLELRVGDPAVLAGLHRALVGMRPGESKTALIPADEAFGRRMEELIMKLDAKALPGEVRPQVGEILQLQSDRGAQVAAQVIQVSPEEITLDANHPLAGEDVAFDIELLGIGPASAAN
jgi:peptidylprolyl isomerase